MSPLFRMLMRQKSRFAGGADDLPLPPIWRWIFALALILLAGGFALLLWFGW